MFIGGLVTLLSAAVERHVRFQTRSLYRIWSLRHRQNPEAFVDGLLET